LKECVNFKFLALKRRKKTFPFVSAQNVSKNLQNWIEYGNKSCVAANMSNILVSHWVYYCVTL